MSMGMLGAMAGAGGAIQGMGKTMEQSILKKEHEAWLEQKQIRLAQLQEEMLIKREERADARAATPGTREHQEAETRRLQREGAELALSDARDKKANVDVSSGRDAQYSDGSFAVVGDDGRVRKLNADGTPKSGLLNQAGQLAGESMNDFNMSTMSHRERLANEREERMARSSQASAARQAALADLQIKKYKDDLADADSRRGLLRGYETARLLSQDAAGRGDMEEAESLARGAMTYQSELNIANGGAGDDFKARREQAISLRAEASRLGRESIAVANAAKEAIDPEEKAKLITEATRLSALAAETNKEAARLFGNVGMSYGDMGVPSNKPRSGGLDYDAATGNLFKSGVLVKNVGKNLQGDARDNAVKAALAGTK